MRKLKITLILLFVLAGAAAGGLWYVGFKANVKPGKHILYIPVGATFDQVLDSLEAGDILKDKTTFGWVASVRKYSNKVRPGRYLIPGEMNNWNLVAKLRSGNQDAVKVRFGSHWLVQDALHEIEAKLDLTYNSLLELSKDSAYIASLGFSKETLPCLFIPNTYEFFWNAKPKDIFAALKKNYDAFWKKRTSDLKAVDLTIAQVCTVASIVQRESEQTGEYKTIAGVYMNRVKDGMMLQADPTVKFACGKFDLKRILNRHLETDSPYNTYKYAGIPPGPITNPEQVSIDAVLQYETHDYIFMCAKPDFSGFHNFAVTNAQHEKYAREYRAALDKLNIR